MDCPQVCSGFLYILWIPYLQISIAFMYKRIRSLRNELERICEDHAMANDSLRCLSVLVQNLDQVLTPLDILSHHFSNFNQIHSTLPQFSITLSLTL